MPGSGRWTDYFALQQDLEDNVTDSEADGAQSEIRIVLRGGYIAPESSKAHPESRYGDQGGEAMNTTRSGHVNTMDSSVC